MKNYLVCILYFLYDALWNVPLFVLIMIKKLWINRHKYLLNRAGHWSNDPAWQLLARISDETKELKIAMHKEGNINKKYKNLKALRKIRRKKRLHEAADVANFAMMAGKAKEID